MTKPYQQALDELECYAVQYAGIKEMQGDPNPTVKQMLDNSKMLQELVNLATPRYKKISYFKKIKVISCPWCGRNVDYYDAFCKSCGQALK